MKFLALTVLILFGQSTRAYQFEEKQILSEQKTVNVGQTLSIPLDGRVHFIQRLVIEAFGVGQEALFEVVVNGTVKGTIHVPGRDPQYVVTIDSV